MMIRLLLLILLIAGPAFGQSASVPLHNHTSTIGTGTGSIVQLAGRFRSYLQLINDSAATMYCTVDDTTAASGHGIWLGPNTAAGNQVVFDARVPRGAVRCYGSATGRLIIIEGR